MTQTLKNHQENQCKVIGLLSKLEGFISQGNEFGLAISNDIKDKLANSLQMIEDDKLKIALVGGFSEGKTSIAAAWLGKIDPSTMNISASESSNSVKVYDIDEQYQLIDTPGLYGYKEQASIDSAEIEKYKDITKKYVSEAHIILYVMNSKNPIKESHIDDLKWLFKELNLLSRTVFVLSRFDEVADVEDEDDYQAKFKIKEENVKDRLANILTLSSTEQSQLRVVAVSANPFDEGVAYWMDNLEEFKKLSHIDLLQKATTEIVQKNGGYEGVVEETRKSIVGDILLKELPRIEEKQQQITEEISKLNHIYDLEKGEISNVDRRIINAKSNLRNNFNSYFSDLILQLNGTSLETINDFLVREIGDNGSIISSKIETLFEKETNQINNSLNNQAINFNAEIESIDTAIGSLTKQGLNYLIKNIRLDNVTVKLARDGLVSGGKLLGFNLGSALKFKPWGAIKAAQNINNLMPFLGLAMEAWSTWSQAKKQEEFQKAKQKLQEDFQKQQKEILELISSDSFAPKFFPILVEMQKKIDEILSLINSHNEQIMAFNQWREQGKIIEGEFRNLS